jgi:hypothetical protein
VAYGAGNEYHREVVHKTVIHLMYPIQRRWKAMYIPLIMSDVDGVVEREDPPATRPMGSRGVN